jgi:hypothetical protein
MAFLPFFERTFFSIYNIFKTKDFTRGKDDQRLQFLPGDQLTSAWIGDFL